MKKFYSAVLFVALLLIASLGVLTACNNANPTAVPTEEPVVEETATVEEEPAVEEADQPEETEASSEAKGSINLYTSQPEADAQKLIEAFNALYPDVTVNVFRSGTEEVISKVIAEKEANAIQADVLLVADAATFESLKAQDLLLEYASPELENIDPSFYDVDHQYTGTKIISTGIAVNTELVTDAPTALADLIKPEYKDELVMPSPLYSGSAAYNLSVITRTDGLGWEFYEGLKENNVMVGKGNGSVQEALLNNQKGLGILVDYMALRAKAGGAPIDFIYPSEGSLTVTEPIGIVKESDVPELGKLFVDFILSEAGQTVTAEIGYTPIRKGITPPEGFKSADEITNLTYDIATLVSERENDKTKFADMFGSN